MKTSESIDQIAPAFLAAQAAMKPLFKDAVNPHLKNQYASLTAVLDTAMAPFRENGISVLQSGAFLEGGEFGVTTRLLHTSGQWIETTTPVYVAKRDAQAIGSATTYGRRYSLMALAGLVAEDNDGAAASDGERQKLHKEKPFPKGEKPISAGAVADIEEKMKLLALDAEQRRVAVTWFCGDRTDNANNLTAEEGVKVINFLQGKLTAENVSKA